MSVRRLSGSAWAALIGPGIHHGAAAKMGGKVLHCRIRMWLCIKAVRLRGAAGPAPAPGSARPVHAGPHPCGHAGQHGSERCRRAYVKPCGLKNVVEAGRQSSHTAAAPSSQAAVNRTMLA